MGQPLRVALVGPSSELVGGVATVSRQLLDAVDPGRVQLIPIVTMAGGGKASKAVRAMSALAELAAAAPDLVHVHVADGASVLRKAALIRSLGAEVPVVAHLHFADADAAVRAPGWSVVAERADRVLALSQAMAAVVGPRCNGPVEVLANVVDVEAFSPGGARDGSLLHVGGADPRKGLSVLLEARADLDEPPPLSVAGAGPIPAAPGVTSLGVLGPADLAQAYRRAGVVCFPSLAEGAPMAVLEAMACGCPIVASEVGGVAEMVGGGALLVPPGNVPALQAALSALLPLQAAAFRRVLCAR